MTENVTMHRALILCLLGACSAALAAEPDWSVRVAPFKQVFPALELSQARRTDQPSATDHVLGGGSGLIAVRVRARHPGERVTLGIAIPEIGPAQRFGATLAQAEVDYELHPPLAWDAAGLRALKAAKAAHMNFTLQRDGDAAEEREVAVSLRPLDEALYFVRDGKDSVDLAWIFAAYVNERDPVVDEILAAARDDGLLENSAANDAGAVYRQAWAVWHTLAAHGIRYSGADPAIERGPHVFSQRVRFLADTWADRSANCVDGSVLIASVLQRLGLRSFLVLVPGHAFVGVYTDADARHAAYLETTLLGANIAASAHTPAFTAGVTMTRERRASVASFTAALAAGAERHARVAAKLDGRHRPDYAVIDIGAARALGIQPIEAAGNDQPPPNRNVNFAPPSTGELDTSRLPR
jgi:hypothetical protein